MRGGLSGRRFVLGLLRSIGQHFERLERFRHILRHAKQAEVVELPTSYGALRGARERVRQTTKTPRAARPGEAGFAFVGPSGLNPDGAFLARRVMALRPRLRRRAARPDLFQYVRAKTRVPAAAGKRGRAL